MKVLFDTLVLVAAMLESHPAHERALPWLQRAKRKEIVAVVAAHSLAELYAILTRLPLKPPIPPSLAWQMLRENVLALLEVIPLSEGDYHPVLEHLSQTGIAGGVTYDALIAYAAIKAQVDQLLTLNEKDFRKVYPALSERIVAP